MDTTKIHEEDKHFTTDGYLSDPELTVNLLFYLTLLLDGSFILAGENITSLFEDCTT